MQARPAGVRVKSEDGRAARHPTYRNVIFVAFADLAKHASTEAHDFTCSMAELKGHVSVNVETYFPGKKRDSYGTPKSIGSFTRRVAAAEKALSVGPVGTRADIDTISVADTALFDEHLSFALTLYTTDTSLSVVWPSSEVQGAPRPCNPPPVVPSKPARVGKSSAAASADAPTQKDGVTAAFADFAKKGAGPFTSFRASQEDFHSFIVRNKSVYLPGLEFQAIRYRANRYVREGDFAALTSKGNLKPIMPFSHQRFQGALARVHGTGGASSTGSSEQPSSTAPCTPVAARGQAKVGVSKARTATAGKGKGRRADAGSSSNSGPNSPVPTYGEGIVAAFADLAGRALCDIYEYGIDAGELGHYIAQYRRVFLRGKIGDDAQLRGQINRFLQTTSAVSLDSDRRVTAVKGLFDECLLAARQKMRVRDVQVFAPVTSATRRRLRQESVCETFVSIGVEQTDVCNISKQIVSEIQKYCPRVRSWENVEKGVEGSIRACRKLLCGPGGAVRKAEQGEGVEETAAAKAQRQRLEKRKRISLALGKTDGPALSAPKPKRPKTELVPRRSSLAPMAIGALAAKDEVKPASDDVKTTGLNRQAADVSASRGGTLPASHHCGKSDNWGVVAFDYSALVCSSLSISTFLEALCQLLC